MTSLSHDDGIEVLSTSADYVTLTDNSDYVTLTDNADYVTSRTMPATLGFRERGFTAPRCGVRGEKRRSDRRRRRRGSRGR
ncbi:hypothetical protein NP493_64g06070 [Ridgeia piscesae]|uniref:Uncharacterized protein n=1 Tax=Ridgeia piscesae TaxID=27915 RepID=A0AAD9PA08_RIDPI|nr:hypothetical protein NP493_64g06070 [Ridgeia piscesae]